MPPYSDLLWTIEWNKHNIIISCCYDNRLQSSRLLVIALNNAMFMLGMALLQQLLLRSKMSRKWFYVPLFIYFLFTFKLVIVIRNFCIVVRFPDLGHFGIMYLLSSSASIFWFWMWWRCLPTFDPHTVEYKSESSSVRYPVSEFIRSYQRFKISSFR